MAKEKTFHVYLTTRGIAKFKRLLDSSVLSKEVGRENNNKIRLNLFPESHQITGLRNACSRMKVGLYSDSVQ